MFGCAGRAYLLGYNCADERELDAAYRYEYVIKVQSYFHTIVSNFGRFIPDSVVLVVAWRQSPCVDWHVWVLTTLYE